MKKYISSILLVLIFAAAGWAFIYEKNRAEQSETVATVSEAQKNWNWDWIMSEIDFLAEAAKKHQLNKNQIKINIIYKIIFKYKKYDLV